MEAYKVDVKDIWNPRETLIYTPFGVEPLANSRCGKAQRDGVGKVVDYWDSLVDQGLRPWIGYCHFPSGAKKYMYGGTRIDVHSAWSWGDPETIGLQREEADWGQPMRIAPEGPSRTLSKTSWADTLAYLRVAAAAMWNQGKLSDPFMMAIAKYGDELMSYAYS